MINLFRIAFVLLFIMSCANDSNSNNPQLAKEIDNLVIFAKSYGLIKYFHPSDNAAKIDWDLFAVYGSEYVRERSGKNTNNDILENLYSPIAPTVSFNNEKVGINNIHKIDSCSNWAYWQHQGLGMDSQDNSNIYFSTRVNATTRKSEASSFGSIMKKVSAKNYVGKQILLRARVRLKDRSTGSGHLRMKITDKEDNVLFFTAMTKKPIKKHEWADYSISAHVDSLAHEIAFGFSLKGEGTFLVDDYSILVGPSDPNSATLPDDDHGEDFNEIVIRSDWKRDGSGYELLMDEVDSEHENGGLSIKFIDSITERVEGKLFEETPEPGQIIERKLGKNTFCSLPISLCLKNGKTQPLVPDTVFKQFYEKLSATEIDSTDLDFRIGNVIMVYNIVQHFDPYLKVLKLDWEKELRKALVKSYQDKTFDDHIGTLEEMIAALKDGHGRIEGYIKDGGRLPIAWEIIESKLVITNVLDDKLPVKLGDVVSEINGENSRVFLDRFRSRISAGTDGWLNCRLKEESVIGKPGDELKITVNGEHISLLYNDTILNEGSRKNSFRRTFKNISEHTKYVNLEMANMEAIYTFMPELLKAKNLIFDIRGKPYVSPDIISHLLKENDTSSSWMKLPKYIYPDQENFVGYMDGSWHLKTKKPYLGDKNIVFLTNGNAISYAESLLGYAKGYNLGKIIGQPTAGANGNYNASSLLGGLKFLWTGLNLVLHNGDRIYAKGIQPDIEVEETIDGLRENKDELLDYAIQYLEDNGN